MSHKQLMEAVRAGHFKSVKKALDKGVNAYQNDNEAIKIAIVRGYKEITMLLIIHADRRIESGEQALILACKINRLKLIKHLVDNGVVLHTKQSRSEAYDYLTRRTFSNRPLSEKEMINISPTMSLLGLEMPVDAANNKSTSTQIPEEHSTRQLFRVICSD